MKKKPWMHSVAWLKIVLSNNGSSGAANKSIIFTSHAMCAAFNSGRCSEFHDFTVNVIRAQASASEVSYILGFSCDWVRGEDNQDVGGASRVFLPRIHIGTVFRSNLN
jgi:hypothetical protein